MKDLYTTHNKHIELWLKIICFAIICMIFIGGFTRLTNSGLSITEWKPITGIFPPLTEESWNQEFDKYKESPEYLKINNSIEIKEFKSIFWVEFIHRIAGRITGILYLLPLLYFLVNGTISGNNIFIYLIGVILLFAQGFAGWYMVKSGLTSNPHVSHFRLAIHLLLAILLYSILFWQLMRNSFDIIILSTKTNLSRINLCLNISLTLLFIQITFGAFVAGLDAGLVYNSFPLMGESFVPHELNSNALSLQSFYDPVFVQFIHRILAYVTTTAILISCFIGFKIQNFLLSKTLVYTIIALIFQMIAGILTLVNQVPITIALIHQLGAVILLSCLLWSKYLVNTVDK